MKVYGSKSIYSALVTLTMLLFLVSETAAAGTAGSDSGIHSDHYGTEPFSDAAAQAVENGGYSYYISGSTLRLKITDTTAAIIVAQYNESGRLTNAQIKTAKESGTTFDVELTETNYRIFSVSRKTFMPRCPVQKNRSDTAAINIPQTGWTTAVPSTYMTASGQPGTVERLDYATKDYAGDGSEIRKTAYVYLPYGYDSADTGTRYDVVYLMHGWGGSAGEYFTMSSLKNVFDNLMEKGDMKPAILVSATFYNESSDRDFGGSVTELRAFHQDFENALMPAVEGKYHTYAMSTSDADLKASRDHRAFAGFSLGSVTTWLEFCYDYDYIRYFAPMSGSCWYYGTYGDFRFKENVDYIENLVKEQNLDERGYALELSKKGYNAFALIYRPGYDTAMADLTRAVAFITEHADELGVDPQGYSLWGGSAGARMAAAVGNADGLAAYSGRNDLPQAAAVIMQYTGYTTVSPSDAPTYANCGTSDGIAGWRTMENRLNTLTKTYGIPTEFHAYPGLPHGFGLGTGTVAEGWIDAAVAFWEANQ